jgi:hypothetical protein
MQSNPAAPPRRCVYTALTNNYETLNEQPAALKSSLPFICFTDDPSLTSETWQIRPLKLLFGEDAMRSQRDYKLRPHRYLPEFDESLYIDNSVVLKVAPEEIFESVDLSAGLSIPVHSHRESILDEFARVASLQLDDPARIAEQLGHYTTENPELLQEKPFWCAIMLRDHHNQVMVAAMELWLAHILRYARRDQLSARFVFNKTGLVPHRLDIDNAESWFHTWPNAADRKTELRSWRASDPLTVKTLRIAELEAETTRLTSAYNAMLHSTTWRLMEPFRKLVNVFRNGRGLPGVRPSRSLIFAFAPPASTWPSALVRGRQLMTLIQEVRPDITCRASPLRRLMRCRNENIFLTKSALRSITQEMIRGLRARGNCLIADFVDERIDEANAAAVNVLISSSMSQANFFRKRFPNIPVFHVIHHVDLRVPAILPPSGRARFGYYGALENCLHVKEIGGLVRIVPADDAGDRNWIARLAESNAHYALRPAVDAGRFKPFIKGFVAAHCGAPVVVAAGNEEARHYLGPDYPFVIADESLPSVLTHLEHFAAEFGSPLWECAVEVMRGVAERTGRATIERELREFLGAILS